MDYLQKAAADCEFFKPAAIQDSRCVLRGSTAFFVVFFTLRIFVANQIIKKNALTFPYGKQPLSRAKDDLIYD